MEGQGFSGGWFGGEDVLVAVNAQHQTKQDVGYDDSASAGREEGEGGRGGGEEA